MPQFTAVINPALDKHFPAHSGVRVIAEPGRYYVSSAYTLAVNIITKKEKIEEQMACDDEGDGANKRTLMYYVNDGIYGSFHNILFGARYMPSLHKKPKPDEPMYPCSIWGQTCNWTALWSGDLLDPLPGDWKGEAGP
ncbi:ornithine decarboxylase 1-like [Conger conger]|uniref:ornithine decarboxylase 1-like n=1 Tax=Conger conger TaxID=82655 RepID=UPI002A5A22F9|nr:ornithine decarboxylase 1-like [Conger conger]